MAGLELTDNEKVRCTSFSLTMDARIWWETMEGKYDIETMTWAEFTAEFNERFFNANLTNEYWRKLENLQQGSMTVTELMQEFRRLIRLCPNAAASEEDKVRRLLKALRPEIAVLCYEGDKAPDTAEKCFRAALLRESHLARSSSAATITPARPFQARPSGQGHSRPHQGQNWRPGSNKKRQFPGQ